MYRHRFFLRGSIAEVAWLNQQAARGQQLVAIRGLTYQFKSVSTAPQLTAEYLPKTTLQTMAPDFQPVASHIFHVDDLAVAYSQITENQRVVTNDEPYRLAVYRHARDVALNWLNGWVLSVWLFISAVIVLSSQLQATPLLTRLLLIVLAVSAGAMVVGASVAVLAAVRCHREVCRLIRLTGDDRDAWKPTFHIWFKHQTSTPDTERLEALGTWQLTMHNQRGDYYFDLKTLLSEQEIKQTLAKLVAQQDFVVMSWLGLYPL
ncbi:hypothetical protein [Lactiplantibacillus herbarum]|uniref:hypothetical protein n=1 Tax=Lactiplantibacillus herbarum TaxID=1670446 RepID=UPI00064EB5B0|nr:hypothetical protein [Lactiplantibacillus herbarum]